MHKNQVTEVNVELTLSPSSATGSEPVVNIHTSPLSDDIRGAITNGVKLACTHGKSCTKYTHILVELFAI